MVKTKSQGRARKAGQLNVGTKFLKETLIFMRSVRAKTMSEPATQKTLSSHLFQSTSHLIIPVKQVSLDERMSARVPGQRLIMSFPCQRQLAPVQFEAGKLFLCAESVGFCGEDPESNVISIPNCPSLFY